MFHIEPSEKSPITIDSWNEYKLYNFQLDGIDCKVICPDKEAPQRPWLWRARFFDCWPYIDIAMLECGYHVAYIDVAGLFGSSKAVKRFDNFYNYVVNEHSFNPKVALVGYSRGGLAVYNWAARNPQKTACIYADNPVCDIKS
ncbi:MAG: alpha/beta hydrolase [Lentisphaerae bacterium]|nr:alpha/beta hydrolase [Lentisphaerota bacterium]MCP4101758.1 alpha/beta hydrolase [Lentisphaerota bacterium]